MALTLILPLTDGESPFELGLELAGGALVTYRCDFDSIPDAYADLGRAEILALAKETLVGRLLHHFDTLPEVVVTGDGGIQVSLPGTADQAQILDTVGQTYRLTFRRALAVSDSPPENPRGFVRAYEGRWFDLGEELLAGDALDPRTIRVDSASGGSLDALRQGVGVTFEFRPPHDERFEEITRESIGKTLVILLDDTVEWAGTVESTIRGPGTLSGGYTLEEAREVAGLLRSGNLPLSLEIESLSAVGPSLGQEIFDRGALALAASLVLLALLLALAYGHQPALWLTAWVSLASLGFSILALISLFGLTLDLVAIAGLVLSVGMGMDAFILVFEALEAERRVPTSSGRSPLATLRAIYGFRGEGRTLLHANTTTLLVVSMLLASDRLQSFALFLIVGLAASLFTLLITRGLLELLARRGWLENPSPTAARRTLDTWSPFARLRGASPGLLRGRRIYLASLVLFLGFAAGSRALGGDAAESALGADFQPGLQLRILLPDERPIEPMLAALGERFPTVETRHQTWRSPVTETSASESNEKAAATGYLLTLEGPSWDSAQWNAETPAPSAEAPGEPGAPSPRELADFFATQQVQVESMQAIDSRLSARRIFRSLSVLLGSLLLLGFYLKTVQPWLDGHLSPRSSSAVDPRQRRRIFLGTVLAVVLDLAVVLAALSLLALPIGLPVVAALLTIVGYSVNDSMVLWSHLSQRGSKGQGFRQVAETVDRILGRNLLTSLSTLIPAVAILAVGLEPLRGFAWAVLVGTIAGTLSSVFVVASCALGPEDRVDSRA